MTLRMCCNNFIWSVLAAPSVSIDVKTSHVISKNWRFILINTFVQIIIFSVRNICAFIINDDNNIYMHVIIYTNNNSVVERASYSFIKIPTKFTQNSQYLNRVWRKFPKISHNVCGEKFQHNSHSQIF